MITVKGHECLNTELDRWRIQLLELITTAAVATPRAGHCPPSPRCHSDGFGEHAATTLTAGESISITRIKHCYSRGNIYIYTPRPSLSSSLPLTTPLSGVCWQVCFFSSQIKTLPLWIIGCCVLVLVVSREIWSPLKTKVADILHTQHNTHKPALRASHPGPVCLEESEKSTHLLILQNDRLKCVRPPRLNETTTKSVETGNYFSDPHTETHRPACSNKAGHGRSPLPFW